ncbi:hypothetical protein CSUI_004270 [Cystoisospora suis]|uniref:Uncharacterized protein n=1 Tax=Cystoisospora suis TaxID=483139 RepID=A0A2C6KCB9_9APIC|nr:hypothetical protein CSUI_004270 [Cystoisospora suis]
MSGHTRASGPRLFLTWAFEAAECKESGELREDERIRSSKEGTGELEGKIGEGDPERSLCAVARDSGQTGAGGRRPLE